MVNAVSSRMANLTALVIIRSVYLSAMMVLGPRTICYSDRSIAQFYVR